MLRPATMPKMVSATDCAWLKYVTLTSGQSFVIRTYEHRYVVVRVDEKNSKKLIYAAMMTVLLTRKRRAMAGRLAT